MTRRSFLKKSALAGGALLSTEALRKNDDKLGRDELERLYRQDWMESSKKRPNIILITTDHMRVDNVAANGNEAMETPNLDRMVQNGVSFPRCHCVSPVCMPSRASLFTGKYPSSHGVRCNGVPLNENEVTLTHVLAQEGYYTGQLGKLHFLPHDNRNHRGYHPPYGFDEMLIADEPGCYPDAYGRWLEALGPKAREQGNVPMPGTRGFMNYYPFAGPDNITHAWWVGNETVRFIKENKNRPFFVHAGFYAPHPPLNPPQSQIDRYKGKKLPRRKFKRGEMDLMPNSYQKAAQRLSDIPEEKWQEYKKYFYAMVSNIDVNMGRILEALESENLMNNTLIIFTSDHGDYLGDHGLISKSSHCYNGVVEVPLIIQGPNIPKINRLNSLVELTDIMPTVLDYLNIEIPLGVQGKSMMPLFKGKSEIRDCIYAEYGPTGYWQRVIRTNEAKYKCNTRGEEILFDLQKDEDEFKNIANNRSGKALLDEMRKKMLVKSQEIMIDITERIERY